MNPGGTRSSRPLCTTIACRCWLVVGTNWSSKPIRRHKSIAQGTLVMKLSALRSIK